VKKLGLFFFVPNLGKSNTTSSVQTIIEPEVWKKNVGSFQTRIDSKLQKKNRYSLIQTYQFTSQLLFRTCLARVRGRGFG